jgi:hypothetical protein
VTARPDIPRGTPFRIRDLDLTDALYLPDMAELRGRVGRFLESWRYTGRPVLGLSTNREYYETLEVDWWFYLEDLELATEEEWDAQCVLDTITG